MLSTIARVNSGRMPMATMPMIAAAISDSTIEKPLWGSPASGVLRIFILVTPSISDGSGRGKRGSTPSARGKCWNTQESNAGASRCRAAVPAASLDSSVVWIVRGEGRGAHALRRAVTFGNKSVASKEETDQGAATLAVLEADAAAMEGDDAMRERQAQADAAGAAAGEGVEEAVAHLRRDALPAVGDGHLDTRRQVFDEHLHRSSAAGLPVCPGGGGAAVAEPAVGA